MKTSDKIVDIAIIGGGFFGLYIAEFYAKLGKKVLLIEKEKDAMQRASYVNQARVHNGYHYPRSVLTALRSRVSFPRFIDEFSDSVHSDFDKYYLIANPLGKVTVRQFQKFSERIGAPCDAAPESIRKLTNPKYIHGVFSTKEFAFDSVKLKEIMLERAQNAGVEIWFEYQVNSFERIENRLRLSINQSINIDVVGHIFNCTYSMINAVLERSSLDLIPLKHEMTEMCLVEIPEPLKKVGVTVMCGPFFSVMPFPSTPWHSFSHVRYTPHYEWQDDDLKSYLSADKHYYHNNKQTAWQKMLHDAQRYIPILGETQYRKSLWEVKTILPRSDSDDSRPILFKAHYGFPNFHCVMGGKIDNVYDVITTIKQLGLDQ